MYTLQLENVQKKFGNFIALKNINLRLHAGEIHGFIGPNGAGKSTTIRTILGIYKVTKGNVKVFGLDAWKDSVNIHKSIAYVPGDVNLWGNLSGIEVINMLLSFNGEIDTSKRDYYIKKFDLDIKKKCRSYSKGNRQKVALVAAFAANAELLIFDEPTSGLDPIMEEVFQECLREKKEAGKTVLLSSHILSEVEELCDRVSIIKKGEIIETGTLDDLRHITRTNIEILPKDRLNNIQEMDGVYNIQKDKNTERVTFQVDTDKINDVLQVISQNNIKDIKITPLNLEELFDFYYNNDDK
ncbi:ABC transporter ATP-binding protein [Streptococcus mutans]|uniref:ABC transporter ATP-binding protein n=1 Tax=Streptococcus mutans TaxID=1309 RepID=UPI000F71CEC5|nr:ABC transporter ATP-binding protein [Streptococcus mutans]MCB5050639.1 ABC transporter ATP-binding protein [Streptococcus mutans]MCY7117617.1 ABC transporter ATP-binding protein [Streptococcus mutans]MCY7125222.1 ABC transporter ATP-binding protein [Streptococcus mutans]MDT9539621.1 ABC transporter ATP-binding protein [Streptococcus mutans]NLQ33802.1 ABC transporter ATP-binding protein [Streptococcus mutans]